MCGICGFCSNDNNYEDHLTYYNKVIGNMTYSIRHRGKDGCNTYITNNCCLGHSRLAIRDINKGLQPMTKHFNGRYATIVFNGEIYNTDELNRITCNYNIGCATSCDTEVLLNLYLTTGTHYFNIINGIFSFAILSENKLILARDHVGVKPLYYYYNDNTFIFASEIKAIKEYGIKTLITDKEIKEIFSIGPAHIPGRTFYNNVHELLPGTTCTIHLNSSPICPEFYQYWKLCSKPFSDSLDNATDYIDFLINDSIKKQLVSDVPICSFLSGGLDSSLVSSVASKYINSDRLGTFSFDFTDNDKYYKAGEFQSSSDRPYVDIMKDYLDSNHQYLFGNSDDLLSKLYECVDARDAPCMADIESSLFHFCSIVAKKYKVALTGECADEVFCGYPWYYKENLTSQNNFPWSININERTIFFKDDFSHFLNVKDYSKEIYEEELKKVPLCDNDDMESREHKQLFYLNIYWFMQMLLTRMDRASMCYSLEARVPFADYRIIEYMYNVPKKIVFLNNKPKGLLINTGRKYLPEKIYNRKKSPYPKTYNPDYENKLIEIFYDTINSSNTFLSIICDKKKVDEILSKTSDYTKPWFGQLMSRPQLIAYLLQIEYFIKK
jgi:asparagine synthase (glutamine-hydrolysing)